MLVSDSTSRQSDLSDLTFKQNVALAGNCHLKQEVIDSNSNVLIRGFHSNKSISAYNMILAVFVPMKCDSKNIFLPTLLNHANNVKNGNVKKISAAAISLVVDLPTIPLRLITSPLRALRHQFRFKEHVIHSTLRKDGSANAAKALKDGVVYIKTERFQDGVQGLSRTKTETITYDRVFIKPLHSHNAKHAFTATTTKTTYYVRNTISDPWIIVKD